MSTQTPPTLGKPPLPGKRSDPKRIAEMIRVDHAGEYAAVSIYRGQHAVFKDLPHKAKIADQLKHMEDEEQDHLDQFNALLMAHDTRPTAMAPVWNIASHVLGVSTALMGEKAAHACTEAVETVIEEHYGDQVVELRAMGEDDLADRFAKFREDELAHRDLAVSEGAKEAPGYPLLSSVIKAGCRFAIKVSERV